MENSSTTCRCALAFSFLLVAVCAGTQPVAAPVPGGAFLDVGGAKLWYEECSPAPVAGSVSSTGVVLLHDGRVHSITGDGVWPASCAKYHVVRYDRRGDGRSEPAKSAFVPENDLFQIMRHVHMDRAILVGNSSGGRLAQDFAIAHPAMVQALFLIGPVVHGMASSDYFNQRGSQNSAPSAHGDLNTTAENRSKDRFLIAGDDPPARRELYNALAQNPRNLKVDGGLEIRPSPPTVVRRSEICVPILVPVGDPDIADVFAYSGAIEAEVPLASFQVWKDTGHLIQIQRPEKLASRFNAFVALAERKEAAVTTTSLPPMLGSMRYSTAQRPCL